MLKAKTSAGVSPDRYILLKNIKKSKMNPRVTKILLLVFRSLEYIKESTQEWWRKYKLCARDGVRDVSEMKRHIYVYVKSLFPGRAPPRKSNKSFCTSKSTLKNHMYNAIMTQRLAKVDQANRIEKMKVWQAEN